MSEATAARAGAAEMASWRARHAAAMDAQVVRWCWPERGLGEVYLLRVGAQGVGYGVVGGAPGEARDEVSEWYTEGVNAEDEAALLRALIAASGARRMCVQSNDWGALRVMTTHAATIETGSILFRDGGGETPGLSARLAFRRLEAGALVFTHTSEPVGAWCVEERGEVVATGGVLTHYNPPFGDIHMEVAPGARGRGIGSFLVGRLRAFCREAGLRASARCRAENAASRACLARGGMEVCGVMLHARLSWTGGASGSGAAQTST
jgi:GNAT superfamily N-acetyltransferase